MAKTIYVCEKTAEISELQTEVKALVKLMTDNGHDGLPTMVTKLTTAIEISNKQKEIRNRNTWKWAVPAVLFSLTIIGIIISDHYTLKEAPHQYVSKQSMNLWLSEFQKMANSLEKMASSKTIEEMKYYHEEYLKNSKQFDYLEITRGEKK